MSTLRSLATPGPSPPAATSLSTILHAVQTGKETNQRKRFPERCATRLSRSRQDSGSYRWHEQTRSPRTLPELWSLSRQNTLSTTFISFCHIIIKGVEVSTRDVSGLTELTCPDLAPIGKRYTTPDQPRESLPFILPSFPIQAHLTDPDQAHLISFPSLVPFPKEGIPFCHAFLLLPVVDLCELVEQT